jgi:alpha-tubulin suppressor-like RCC1 family protein
MPLGSFRVNGIGRKLTKIEIFELFSWGQNFGAATGLGTDSGNTLTPTKVGSATNWAQVSAGGSSTAAITTTGELWAWGDNTSGQVGVPSVGNQRNTPIRVGAATNWKQVSLGGSHCLAVTTTGELWAWGGNVNRQLGLGVNDSTVGVPTRVGTATNWAFVAAGGNTSYAITTTGQLWAWGLNSFGGIGFGNNNQVNTPTQVGSATDWAQVSSAGNHAIAIKTNGTLWSWGNNTDGRTGRGITTGDTLTPTQVGSATNWAKVSTRFSHVLAITTTGQLWAWGTNTNGQLGRGNTTTPQTSPTQIGSLTNWQEIAAGNNHSLAINSSGELLAWGQNTNGQLGRGNTTTPQTSPIVIGSLTNWSKLGAGGSNSFAITK